VTKVQAQISDLEAAIEKERRSVVQRLQTDYDAAAFLERLLAKTNARQLGTLQSEAAKESEYNMLKRDVDSTQQLYDDVLRKANEAGVASAMRATNIRVIDPARPPFRPHSPNLPLNLAAGLLCGLIVGSGTAVFRERSTIVRRPGDAMALNFLELGVIPSASHARRLGHPWRALLGASQPRSELALATSQDKSNLFNESFRWALTSILFSAGLDNGSGRQVADGRVGRPLRGRVLVVSSAEAMEGKTTVLSNLGIVLAQTNRRVLLVDADLRKPRLHEVFDLPNTGGLTDCLRAPGATALEALMQPTRVDGLWLMPSGPTGDGVAQLLYSANLNTLLRRLRREFDLVLVDSAPMALFPDGRLLGRLSDGVVLVMRANRARTDVLNALRSQLLQDEIPLLGTILNDWRLDGSQLRTYGGYYRKYDAAAG
jgi:capsular exopolysaccharide synthesis family protein